MNKRTKITQRLLPILLILLTILGCKTVSYTKSETEKIYSDTIYLPDDGVENRDEIIKYWKGIFGEDIKVIQTTSDWSDFTPPRRLEPRRLINPYKFKGRMAVRALIDENGNVLNAVAIEGENSELNRLTLSWMKLSWKFKPMTYKGVAVRTIVYIPIEWKD